MKVHFWHAINALKQYTIQNLPSTLPCSVHFEGQTNYMFAYMEVCEDLGFEVMG